MVSYMKNVEMNSTMYIYIHYRCRKLHSDSEDSFTLHEYYEWCWDTLLPIYRAVIVRLQ